LSRSHFAKMGCSILCLSDSCLFPVSHEWSLP
jgi:hypothetical protein